MNVNQNPKIHTLGQEEMEQATAQIWFGDTAISKKPSSSIYLWRKCLSWQQGSR